MTHFMTVLSKGIEEAASLGHRSKEFHIPTVFGLPPTEAVLKCYINWLESGGFKVMRGDKTYAPFLLTVEW